MLAEKDEVKNSKGHVIGYKPKYRLDRLLGIERPTELPTAEQVRASLGGL
jgi:regulatory protein YycH of two-component signal transduction system YycFG